MYEWSVIYEDNHLIAINKPNGMIVQADETTATPLVDEVKEYIKHKYNKPGKVFLEPAHRIDRPVSGLIVMARTTKALARMTGLFREREIEKTYWAIVKDRPKLENETLVHYLKKDTDKNKSRAYDKEVSDSKRAELTYKLLRVIGQHSLLEIKPLTGRPHQIRVQLSTIGNPIRGDVKYGYPKANANQSINLHARSLKFVHPVTKISIVIEASLPVDDIWNEFKKTM